MTDGQLVARWAEAWTLSTAAADANAVSKVGPDDDDPTASDRTRSLQAGNWPRSPSPISRPPQGDLVIGVLQSIHEKVAEAQNVFLRHTIKRSFLQSQTSSSHVQAAFSQIPPLRRTSSHTAQEAFAVPLLLSPKCPCHCNSVCQPTCEETFTSKLCSEKKWPRMLSHQPSVSASLADARPHPRRCTARKRQKVNHESDDSSSVSCKPNAPQPSPHPSLQKKPSQESDGHLSASQWFDNANSNIQRKLQNQSADDGMSTHS